MLNKTKILSRLELIYKEEAELIYQQIEALIHKYHLIQGNGSDWVTEKDSLLITYGSSIYDNDRHSLQVFNEFLLKRVKNLISAVHLLPFYPYSSDDGFSVIDYRTVDENLGDWEDIVTLSDHYHLMFDAVINHASVSSDWFKGFINGDEVYKDYFITCNPEQDYSLVTRPRTLPLLTPFDTNEGIKHIWTTFSEDQVDLNYKSPKVLLEILDILLLYISKGARYIRLDAIGFLWKTLGTTCIHLKETHEIIKLMKEVIGEVAKGIILITETNTPHKENISYFGNGYDEASMVYQFSLPPLTLFAFLSKDSTKLLKWLNTIEPTTEATTFLNFLASHDGIGLRPVEDILSEKEIEFLVDNTINNGGRISYKSNADGTKSPYELNINYMEALCYSYENDQVKVDKFIASQGILLSLKGVPGIYIHSLLGSSNDIESIEATGINRRINRAKMEYKQLVKELDDHQSIRHKVFESYKELLRARKSDSAFSPNANQKVLVIDKRLFSIERRDKATKSKVLVIINISDETFEVKLPYKGINIINYKVIKHKKHNIKPYEILWIKER